MELDDVELVNNDGSPLWRQALLAVEPIGVQGAGEAAEPGVGGLLPVCRDGPARPLSHRLLEDEEALRNGARAHARGA